MLALGIVGDANAIVDRCRVLLAAGAAHLSFGPPLGPDAVRSVTRLGREVLTALEAGSLQPGS
jgi:5,10-methylenetetrahydromethanopterin reductase